MKPRKPLPRSTKPLKRTPLARGTKPIKAKRKAPRRVSVARDQSYMDFLKTQFCVVCAYSVGGQKFTCQLTPSEPAHTGKTNGMRSKSSDESCIPLCSRHHSEMDGRITVKITTKAAFAEKYRIDLAEEAARHHALYVAQK